MENKRRIRRLGFLSTLLLLLAVFLVGCATAGDPTRSFRDQEYARPGGMPLTIDLDLPPDTGQAPPLIVWIHGGAWKFGNKRYRLLIHDLTRDGFAIASIDYRFSNQAIWPAQLEDCLAAIDWLRTHAERFGFDPERIAVAGDSAGGQLAAMVGLREGAPSIQAVLAVYPPTDMVLLAASHGNKPTGLLTDLLGGSVTERPAAARDASPVEFVDAADPPVLLIHGDRDRVVPLNQSQVLHKKLREAGVESKLVVVKGRGHAFGLTPELLQMVSEFFGKHLGKE